MARTIAERSDVLPLLAEVFRTYGYEGASLARISEGTKLGKGSIYHFFPGGKDEMADAVLTEINLWFRTHVFAPLLRPELEAGAAVATMFAETARYFLSGEKACLFAIFALGNERERFAQKVDAYFSDWSAALAGCLRRLGHSAEQAQALANDTVGGIQGALVLARAARRPVLFMEALQRMQQRLAK